MHFTALLLLIIIGICAVSLSTTVNIIVIWKMLNSGYPVIGVAMVLMGLIFLGYTLSLIIKKK